jgi:hypothetical protein
VAFNGRYQHPLLAGFWLHRERSLLLLWDFSLSFSACFACLYERLGRCRATARTVFVFKVSMCSLLCFALFHRLSSRCSVGSKDACMNDTSPRAQAMLPLSGGD